MSTKRTSGEAEHSDSPHLKVPNSVAIPKILRNVSLTAIAVVPGLALIEDRLENLVIHFLCFSVVLGVQQCSDFDAQDVVALRQNDLHPPVSRAHHRGAIEHDCGKCSG